jgi:hypothetical protein
MTVPYNVPDFIEFISDFEVIHSDEYLDSKGDDMVSGKLKFAVENDIFPTRRALLRTLAHLLRLKYSKLLAKYKYSLRITFPTITLTSGTATFLIETNDSRSVGY